MTTNLLNDWPLDATTVTRHDLERQVARQQRTIDKAARSVRFAIERLQQDIQYHQRDYEDTPKRRAYLTAKITEKEHTINILRDQLEILTGSRFPEEENK